MANELFNNEDFEETFLYSDDENDGPEILNPDIETVERKSKNNTVLWALAALVIIALIYILYNNFKNDN